MITINNNDDDDDDNLDGVQTDKEPLHYCHSAG